VLDFTAKKIKLIRPTKPGFLLLQYANGEKEIISVFDAPNLSSVITESPDLVGHSFSLCPYCSDFLNEKYKYIYYAKVIKGRVYSYRSKEFKEIILERSCDSCKISLFEWEIDSPFIEAEHITFLGVRTLIRKEMVIMSPNVCPGVRLVAIGNKQHVSTCEEFPRCKNTMVCLPDWHITINKSKITI